MSNRNEELLIYLRIAVIGQTYAIAVTPAASFRKLLRIFFNEIRANLRHLYLPDGEEKIIEKHTGMVCDPLVSLRTLGVKSGMTFLIF